MIFNRHSEVEGKHAFLSASNYHWLGYDLDKLTNRYFSRMSAKRGTDLHLLAHEAIRLGVLLDPSNEALAAYVNDAINLNMKCEQVLFYSHNAFGTADTISFEENLLRIHDLKNGITATSFKQLYVYCAFFCLEYSISPYDIDIELRIYQREECRIDTPSPELIESIIDKIVEFDLHIESIKER